MSRSRCILAASALRRADGRGGAGIVCCVLHRYGKPAPRGRQSRPEQRGDGWRSLLLFPSSRRRDFCWYLAMTTIDCMAEDFTQRTHPRLRNRACSLPASIQKPTQASSHEHYPCCHPQRPPVGRSPSHRRQPYSPPTTKGGAGPPSVPGLGFKRGKRGRQRRATSTLRGRGRGQPTAKVVFGFFPLSPRKLGSRPLSPPGDAKDALWECLGADLVPPHQGGEKNGR